MRSNKDQCYHLDKITNIQCLYKKSVRNWNGVNESEMIMYL